MYNEFHKTKGHYLVTNQVWSDKWDPIVTKRTPLFEPWFNECIFVNDARVQILHLCVLFSWAESKWSFRPRLDSNTLSQISQIYSLLDELFMLTNDIINWQRRQLNPKVLLSCPRKSLQWHYLQAYIRVMLDKLKCNASHYFWLFFEGNELKTSWII